MHDSPTRHHDALVCAALPSPRVAHTLLTVVRQAASPCRALSAFLVLALTSLAATTGQAQAWGGTGHAVVAELAASRMTPQTRARVEAILATEPGSSLASIASWADEQRSHVTGRWHYVNFPRGNCQYDEASLCAGGHCVVGAIERQSRQLAASHDPSEQFKALRYVVHFVADVHQPLHAGFEDDKGGNRYQVQWGGRSTNLHALWDSGLIDTLTPSAAALLDRIQTRRSTPPPETSPATWAEESCRIVQAEGFYPSRKPTGNYVETYEPVLLDRLDMAAWRLAALLDRYLGVSRP